MKLKVLYLYPEFLSLYGDRGNIEVLYRRATKRNINIEIVEAKYGSVINYSDYEDINFVFMGGGSDLNQKTLYEDLLLKKKGFIGDYIASGKTGLFICGAYQLLGKYYQTQDGEKIEGLGILDFHTINEGKKNRSVGQTRIKITNEIKDPIFKKKETQDIFGFVNHGGQTYLPERYDSFGKVISGYGNNKKSKNEGIFFQGIIGTYLHGPILSLNPALCDFFIKKSLSLTDLDPLDDSLIINARRNLR